MLFLANLPWYASFSWYQLHLWSYEHNWLYGIFRECKVEIFFVIVSYEHIDIIFQMLFFKAKFTSLFLIESVTVNFFLLFFFFCFFFVEPLRFIVVCYQVIYDNYACMKIFDSQFFKTLSANIFLGENLELELKCHKIRIILIIFHHMRKKMTWF